MDQNFKFCGTIGYGDSYLGFLFRHFKLFRLHAKLHVAAAAVRAHNGKRSGHRCMIGRSPNSYLLGHVTGLLFCLYVKLFLPSICNFVDFWSSFCCIVLDFELADKKVIKELGVFIDGKVQGHSIVLQRSTNQQIKRFGAQKTCTELSGPVDVWTTVTFQTFSLEL